MSSAFFYRERNGMFVMASLAIWFGLLGIFGPYMPANAQATNKQMSVKMNDSEVVGHWVRKKGRWTFLKVSRVRKLSTTRRFTSSREQAPVTTGSIRPYQGKKINKRALRAQLADEIGRWAKIGNRWEWHEADVTRQADAPLGQTKTRTGNSNEQQARWVQRHGGWVFEVVARQDVVRNI